MGNRSKAIEKTARNTEFERMRQRVTALTATLTAMYEFYGPLPTKINKRLETIMYMDIKLGMPRHPANVHREILAAVKEFKCQDNSPAIG